MEKGPSQEQVPPEENSPEQVPPDDPGLQELRRRIRQAEIPPSATGSLNIATWNIRRFGKTDRTERSNVYIAEILRPFDLIAIQEVNETSDALELLCRRLGPEWAYLSGGGGPDRMSSAFVYRRDRVRHTGLAAFLPNPPDFAWRRPPYVCGFEADGFRFAAIAIHVVYGDTPTDRTAEVTELGTEVRRWLDAAGESAGPAIVLGTHQADHPELQKALTSTGLAFTAPGAVATNLTGKKSYDGILVPDREPAIESTAGGVLDFEVGGWQALYPDAVQAPEDRTQFSFQVSDHFPVWTQIVTSRVGVAEPSSDISDYAVLPGYRSDDPYGRDRLDVTGDVNSLCDVIMARDWGPPLAIGLFGDWGTGKSFFIRLMKQRIGALDTQSQAAELQQLETSYATNVLQVDFNAWLYVDANLWASLAVQIFEQVTEALFGKPEDEEERQYAAARAELFGELETTRGRIEEIRQEEQVAKSMQQNAEDDLDDYDQELVETRGKLSRLADLQVDDVKELLATNPELEKQWQAVADDLGLADAAAAYEQVQETVDQGRQLGRRLKRIFEWFRSSRSSVAIAVVGVIVLVGIPVGLAMFPPGSAERVGTLIVSAATAVTTWVTALRPHFARAKRALSTVEAAQGMADGVVEREKEKLRERIAVQQQKVSDANERLVDEQRRLAEIEQKLVDIGKGRGLDTFLHDRIGSADYVERLGIIAMVRRDFEQLTLRLKRGVTMGPEDERTRVKIDRVVVYIDDLDRCSPERVVEVLQAVHLLLAVPLFIVVVAVDSRWLLQSLNLYYHELLTPRGDARDQPAEEALAWASSPQNYLEKIFQIPFTLRPMSHAGYVSLVRSLFEPEEGFLEELAREEAAAAAAAAGRAVKPEATALVLEPPGATDVDEVPPEELGGEQADVKEPAGEPAGERAEGGEASGERADDEEPGGEPTGEQDANEEPLEDAGRTDKAIDLSPQSLDIKDWELEFLEQLAPLRSTPRSVKKMVNLYRLIRASTTPAELPHLVGNADEGGEYECVLLMLSILAGFPALAPDFFRELSKTQFRRLDEFVEQFIPDGEDGTSVRNVVGELNQQDAVRWQHFCSAMEATLPGLKVAKRVETLDKWSQRVARYSFRAGHVLSALPEEFPGE